MQPSSAGFLFSGRIKEMNAQIDFAKMQGFVPAIVQDDATDEVLMLGFMDVAAFKKTLSGGYVTFFSRTRNELWMKGESSGNRLRVISISTDCDRDTFLIRVQVEGAGVVCHLGTRSCFTQEIPFGTAKTGREEILQ
jgi:phosphoribosyl-ATP pyrophosphohydrolase/phosphoribosyl-AMP cyclohydrolase